MSKIYRIRVTGDVLETVNAMRRHNIDGQVITFGREPVYIEADELPEELADDNYLRIDTVDAAPAGVRVIQKKKRLPPPPDWEQHKKRLPPPDDGGLGNLSGDFAELKSERVQEPTAVLATEEPGAVGELKSERVQEPAAVAVGTDPDDTTKLKSERVQHPDPAKRRR